MRLLLVVTRTSCACQAEELYYYSKECFSVARRAPVAAYTKKLSRTRGLSCIKPLQAPDSRHYLQSIASVCVLVNFQGL